MPVLLEGFLYLKRQLIKPWSVYTVIDILTLNILIFMTKMLKIFKYS